MSLELDDDDDDAFASVDVDAVVAARRASSDANATTSTARETDRTSTLPALGPPRARPHVWIDVVSASRARVSCSRERLRAGFAGKLASVPGFEFSRWCATPTDKDAGACWDVPLTRLMEVYVALCAMDAFEIVRGVGSSRCRKRGVPPVTTIEYLSRAPGFRGARDRNRDGEETTTVEDVEARYATIGRNIRDALYPFQVRGVKFVLERRGRALIADQMGVGKTLQAIAAADAYRDAGPLLCVVPASMRFVWADELERWLVDLTPRQVRVIFGSHDKFLLDALAEETRRDDDASKTPRERRVVVTSYHMLAPLLDEFLDVKWGCVIADESHTMHVSKSYAKEETKMTTAAWQLIRRAEYAVLTTGTPSLTKPFDMYYQIDALRPGMLGRDKWDFAEQYCGAQRDERGRVDVSSGSRLFELRALLTHTTMIRRLKRDVMGDLPPKRRQLIPVDITNAIERVGGARIWAKIAKVARAPRDDVEHGDDGAGDDEDADGNILEEDEENGDVEYVLNQKVGQLERGKRVSVAQLVGMLKITPIIEWLESGALKDDSMQLLIFAHHQAVLDALERDVCVKLRNQRRGSYVRIDGSTPSDERKLLVDQFREGAALDDRGVVGVRVALLSVKAAGTGLDFSTASTVVFAELPDDASLLEQAEDRAHRRGNDGGVNVYFMCARGGACAYDEDRWARLGSQLDVCREALDGDDSRVGLNVQAYGTEDKLEPTTRRGPGTRAVEGTTQRSESETRLTASPSARRIGGATEDYPLWFEVSATSGRMHLHAKEDGSEPVRASVSRAQLTRAARSKKYREELPEPLASDGVVFAAAVAFSNTWRAMVARDRNAILARQQPSRAHELYGLAEALNSKIAVAETGSTTRHGSLATLPKDAEWRTMVVTDVSRGRREYEMRIPCRLPKGSTARTVLCVHCVKELNPITADVLRRVDLFCSETCLRAYDQGTSASALRRALYERERGVCVECDLDCDALVRAVHVHRKRSKRVAEILRLAPAFARRGNKVLLNRLAEKPSGGRAWECDHKIAVYEGGGMCTVDNAQTLCVVCHAAKTKAQAKSRAAKRRRDAEARRNRPIAPLTDSSDSDADGNGITDADVEPVFRSTKKPHVTDRPTTTAPRALSDSEEDDGAEDDDIRPVFSSVQRVPA